MIVATFAALVMGQPASILFPIEVKGKWGFIDVGGKVRISPVYEWAGNFSGGRATVARKKAGKYEFAVVDTSGKVTLDWRATILFGPVRGKMAEYKNFRGSEEVSFSYRTFNLSKPNASSAWKSVSDIFSPGDYHPVHAWNDFGGSYEESAVSYEIIEHANGLLGGSDDAFTKLDRSLKIQDKNKDGISQWVRDGKGVGPRMGMMFMNGGDDSYGSEGLFPVRSLSDVDSMNVGFMDASGKIVVPMKFSSVTPFVGGLSRVSGLGFWGYVDRNGKLVWRSQ